MVDFPGVVPSCGSLPPLSPPVTSNPSKKRTKALKDVFLESEDALEGLSVPAAGRPLWAVAEEGWEAGGEEHEFPPRNQPMSGVKRWVEDARKPEKKLGGGNCGDGGLEGSPQSDGIFRDTGEIFSPPNTILLEERAPSVSSPSRRAEASDAALGLPVFPQDRAPSSPVLPPVTHGRGQVKRAFTVSIPALPHRSPFTPSPLTHELPGRPTVVQAPPTVSTRHSLPPISTPHSYSTSLSMVSIDDSLTRDSPCSSSHSFHKDAVPQDQSLPGVFGAHKDFPLSTDKSVFSPGGGSSVAAPGDRGPTGLVRYHTLPALCSKQPHQEDRAARSNGAFSWKKVGEGGSEGDGREGPGETGCPHQNHFERKCQRLGVGPRSASGPSSPNHPGDAA